MITIFIRTAVLYTLIVWMMRLMGKRVTGQLQPFELVVTILIADLAAAPISDINVPLLYGVVPIAALLLLSGVFSIVQLKCEGFRRMVSGRPIVMTAHGIIQYGALKKTCLSLNELFEGYRKAGYLHPEDVGYAILETDGSLSVFPAVKKPLTAGADAPQSKSDRGMPIALILDGHIERDNLPTAAVDRCFIDRQLAAMGLSVRGTLLLLIYETGEIYAQDFQGKCYTHKAVGA